MNARIELTMDKTTFFRWVQEQDRRYDRVDGKAIVQQGSTQHHDRVASEFQFQLRSQLDPDTWLVFGTDFAVDLGDQIRYPDVMVHKMNDDAKAMSTLAPTVLVEVLSSSSVVTDLNIKTPRYRSQRSLDAHIVASQDEARCRVWQRDTRKSDRPFPVEAAIVHGNDARIDIAALGISIALKDNYRGMFKS